MYKYVFTLTNHKGHSLKSNSLSFWESDASFSSEQRRAVMQKQLLFHTEVRTAFTNKIMSMENRKNVQHFSKHVMCHYNTAVTHTCLQLFGKRWRYLSDHWNVCYTYWTNAERELMLLKNSGSHTMPKNNNNTKINFDKTNPMENEQSGTEENSKKLLDIPYWLMDQQQFSVSPAFKRNWTFMTPWNWCCDLHYL